MNDHKTHPVYRRTLERAIKRVQELYGKNPQDRSEKGNARSKAVADVTRRIEDLLLAVEDKEQDAKGV